MEGTVPRNRLVPLLARALSRIERHVARIDLDCRAAVVPGVSDPAALADHREGKSLAAPQLREHLRRLLWIIGGDRNVEDHLLPLTLAPCRRTATQSPCR